MIGNYLSPSLGIAWRYLHNLYTNPAIFLPSLLFPLFFLAAFAGGLSAVGDTPGSVSYTHLDVYKRQGSGRAPGRRSRCCRGAVRAGRGFSSHRRRWSARRGSCVQPSAR